MAASQPRISDDSFSDSHFNCALSSLEEFLQNVYIQRNVFNSFGTIIRQSKANNQVLESHDV